MIDPRRLRVLHAVSIHGTVTAAAESLFLSPSAVSQQLSALEGEVGRDLFERHGRRLVLTPTGRVLARHAARLSTLLEEAEAELVATSHGLTGEVVIAAFPSAITEVVAPAIAALVQSTNGLHVRVNESEGPGAQKLLVEGKVNIAVTVAHHEVALASQNLRRDRLYSEPFDALVPLNHAAAEMDSISLTDLSRDPWITPWPGNPVHDLIFQACEEAGFQPKVHSVSNDFRSVCALVRSGAGVALAPRSAVTMSDVADLRVVPIRNRAPRRNVFVSVRRGTERHPLVNRVLGALHDQARTLEPTT